MPRMCSSCGRPNSDTAIRCLYCTEPLSETAPREGSEQSDTGIPANERHLLILLPQQEPVDSLMTPFGEIMDTSSYDARLALSTRRPRLAKRLDSRKSAEALSASLSGRKIFHYVVAESSALAIPIIPVRSAKMEPESLELNTNSGKLFVRFDTLLLAVVGEITRERYIERHLTTTKGASQSLSSSDRLHLYETGQTNAFELDPASFDWFSVLKRVNRAARINLELFLSELESTAAQIEIDRNFSFETPVTTRSQSNSDLSKLFSERESGAKNEGQIHDNESQFQYYSRWRSCLARHEASSRRGPATG